MKYWFILFCIVIYFFFYITTTTITSTTPGSRSNHHHHHLHTTTTTRPLHLSSVCFSHHISFPQPAERLCVRQNSPNSQNAPLERRGNKKKKNKNEKKKKPADMRLDSLTHSYFFHDDCTGGMKAARRVCLPAAQAAFHAGVPGLPFPYTPLCASSQVRGKQQQKKKLKKNQTNAWR